MALRDDNGERLYRHVEVKVFYPNRRPDKKTFRAASGKAYSDEDISNLLDKIAENLEKQHPFWEFRLISRGPSAFTFDYAGVREDASAVVHLQGSESVPMGSEGSDVSS